MSNTTKITKLFAEQNKPLTLLEMERLLTPMKEKYIEESLIALEYYKYVEKLLLNDVPFYVLTCPYFGTPHFQEHVKPWLEYEQRYVLTVRVNRLQQIETELELE